jgi:hypothetical protein
VVLKFRPSTGHEGPQESRQAITATPRLLYPWGKNPVPIVKEAGVGRKAGLDGCGKSRPYRESIPGPQPVASRYTDYATSVHHGVVFSVIIPYSTVCEYKRFA